MSELDDMERAVSANWANTPTPVQEYLRYLVGEIDRLEAQPPAPTDEQIERGVEVMRAWRFRWPKSAMRNMVRAILRAALQGGEHEG